MTVWKLFTNLCLVRLFIEVDLVGRVGIGVCDGVFMKVGGEGSCLMELGEGESRPRED